MGEDPFEVGQLVGGVELRYQVWKEEQVSSRVFGQMGREKLCMGRTCPAVGVVAEAVEEYDCSRGGRGARGGDDNG